MTKYRVVLKYSDGTTEEDDFLFDTRAEAEEHGKYLCICYHHGSELMSFTEIEDEIINDDDCAEYEVKAEEI